MVNGLINEELKRKYGVIEINSLPRENYHEEEIEDIDWEQLKTFKNVQMERIRFVTDIGFPLYDCSYFHVTIDGKKYDVLNHPFSQVSKKQFKATLYNILQKENIFINGFFDRISILK